MPTSDFARNGKIEVVYKNTPLCNFLWTSGVVTRDAILHDVTPGMYSALSISTTNGVSDRALSADCIESSHDSVWLKYSVFNPYRTTVAPEQQAALTTIILEHQITER